MLNTWSRERDGERDRDRDRERQRKLGKKQRATKAVCFFNKLYCAL